MEIDKKYEYCEETTEGERYCKVKRSIEFDVLDSSGKVIRKAVIGSMPLDIRKKVLNRILKPEVIIQKTLDINQIPINKERFKLKPTTDPTFFYIQHIGTGKFIGDISYNAKENRWEHYSYSKQKYYKLD